MDTAEWLILGVTGFLFCGAFFLMFCFQDPIGRYCDLKERREKREGKRRD